ncbi:PTS sugar transporter subunit IIB [Caldibacillus thermoamylovorans]
MSIELVRIDERLIHGQIAYSWSTAYQVSQIIVVDDEIAQDPTQKMLLGMAVPRGKKHAILSIEEASEFLKDGTNEKVFIVVKSPQILLELLQNGIHLPSINIGGMYFKTGKKEISKTVYLNNEDIEIFKKIKEFDVPCEIRTSPSDKSIDLFKHI